MSIPVARSGEDPVIVLSGLTKLYEPTPKWMRLMARSHIKETVRALDGVDLTVSAGEICAVVGPNGAGKTSLFRIMVGLTTASSGTGTIAGFDVEKESESVRQIVGWMPSEDRSLLMRATSQENLQLHGRLQGMSGKALAERIPAVLEAVGLTPQTQSVVAGLSAGMKARLRLARAMLPGPRVLILDEPTGAVDPIAAHGLLKLIMELVEREKLAVLISSHRLEEIEALQSKALLLDRGRVRYLGDLDTLRDQWDVPLVELVFADETTAERAAAALAAAGNEVSTEETVVRCRPKAKRATGAILADLGPFLGSINHIREVPLPLRDLIAQVYARTADSGRLIG